MLGGDDDRGVCILDHEGKALARIGGVERQIGRAALQDGDQRDDEIERARQAEPDDRAGAGAHCGQPVGQSFGARIEFGHGARPGRDLLGEKIDQGRRCARRRP
jgi:hypothetical protein